MFACALQLVTVTSLGVCIRHPCGGTLTGCRPTLRGLASPALSSHRAMRASTPHQAPPTPFSHPLLLPASIHSSKYLLKPTQGW